MPKYSVDVDVTLYSHVLVEIEAINEDEAWVKAMAVVAEQHETGQLPPTEDWAREIESWEIEEVK